MERLIITTTLFSKGTKKQNLVLQFPDEQIITANTNFYIGSRNPGFCPNVFALQIVFNQPETSSKIHDLTICKNTTTTINAGTNFTYYKWSSGMEGQLQKKQNTELELIL